eukprot:TRINITY_DN6355_c0_g2_i4.p1 TRINITY_DN6355_c0_g2~~TRINITY_DN6355_c0_g2_i4.p1  ORF type:complete len:147 (-),score=30.07 TRINITY_DN6355_c0_g2_i4:209-649(-)
MLRSLVGSEMCIRDRYKAPPILILHLKRFRTSRVSSIGNYFFSHGNQKITALVDFPTTGLDLSNHILGRCDQPPIYDLFAVSNHYGGMGGGHYTAYAMNFKDKLWYEFDDSHVSKTSPDNVVTAAAYVLFYRRRDYTELLSRQTQA